MMYDEILEVEARERLEEQGLDDDTIYYTLADMREDGLFDVPGGDE